MINLSKEDVGNSNRLFSVTKDEFLASYKADDLYKKLKKK